MSYDEPTAILEGRRTTTGNGNYDVATIAAAASRLVDSPPSDAEQQIHDVIEDAQRMFDELLANPSSGLVEEATQFLNAFARYMPPGLAAQARHAISLQEERIAASPDRSGPTGDNWREQRERDDKERKDQAKIADMADDLANAPKPMTPEQWDQAPSTEYPGMTNAEALAAIRRINVNLPFFSQLAVQRGLIKPEDEMAFQAYMRNELWLMEQERAGNTNTAEYRTRKQQQEQAREAHPDFQTASRSIANVANDRENGPLATSIVSGDQNDASAFDSRIDAVNVDAGPPTTVNRGSLAATLDRAEGAIADQPSLRGTFNPLAAGAPNAESVAMNAPIPPTQPRVAATGFDQSTGMI